MTESEELTAIIAKIVALQPPAFQNWAELGANKIRLLGIQTDAQNILLGFHKFHGRMRLDLELTYLVEGVEVTSKGWVTGEAAGAVLDGVPFISSAGIDYDEVNVAD